MFELKIDDIITTKKQHPCGGKTFQVLRIGADYKIKCLTCGKVVLIDDNKIQKNIKEVKSK